jgi:hypothetical protein
MASIVAAVADQAGVREHLRVPQRTELPMART